MPENSPYLKIEASESGISTYVDGSFREILLLYFMAGRSIIPANDDRAKELRRVFLALVTNRQLWELVFDDKNKLGLNTTFIDLSQIQKKQGGKEND